MSVINQMLSELHIPAFLPQNATAEEWPAIRQKLVKMLLEQEYGVIPELPCTVEGKVIKEDHGFCAGKSVLKNVEITVTLPNGSFTYPCALSMPTAPGEHPLFVCINFHPETPARYLPSEEICDRGYGVLSIYYNDVSVDKQDSFADGLAKLLRDAAAERSVEAGQRPGKIAVWAWAMSRALDWAIEQPGVCREHIACIGHSRLGKTALLCGMLDERFACAVSNDSGCSGAAITRGKPGEHVEHITKNFPFWFCENYQQYIRNEDAMPFEQDWLLAAIAPRLLIVGSALEDEWAGPNHEYLSCASASKAWELLDKPGFVHPDRLPEAGDVFHEGNVGYHLRTGKHYLGREDWNRYMDFLDAKGWRA